jgi:hypothetical protein
MKRGPKIVSWFIVCCCCLWAACELLAMVLSASLPKPKKETGLCDPRIVHLAASVKRNGPGGLSLVLPSTRLLATMRHGSVSASFAYLAANGIAAHVLSGSPPQHPAAWDQWILTDWMLKNWTGNEIATNWCSTAVFKKDVVGFHQAAQIIMMKTLEELSDVEMIALFVAALSPKGAFWSLCEDPEGERGRDPFVKELRAKDWFGSEGGWRRWCEAEKRAEASDLQQ